MRLLQLYRHCITVSLQYSLLTSCYKQLGLSCFPKMPYMQLFIELYVPRNYAEGLHLGALVIIIIILHTKTGADTREEG